MSRARDGRFGRRRMRFVALLAALVALGVAVAGCGGGDDTSSATTAEATTATEAAAPADTGAADTGAAATEAADTGATYATPATIALFVPIRNSYVEAVISTAEQTAESLGGSVETFVSDFDAQKQATQIQDAIASGKYNSFIIYPVDSAGVVPFVQEALDDGIKVAVETVVVGPSLETADIQVDGISTSHANPPYLDGQSMGQAVVTACEGIDPCKVIHLAGNFAFGYDVGFQDGLKDVLADHPEIDIVSTVEGEYQADPAYNAVRDALQANADVNVIESTSDVMIGGAERAVTDAGLTAGPDGVKLIGNGGSQIAYDGVEKGTWYGSIVWLPELSAKANVENLFKAVNDQPIEDAAVYTTELSPIGILLNTDNAADFTPQWEGN